ncbi:MAG: EAL domain-containing response regulator [Betaproteobacteria bacterium]
MRIAELSFLAVDDHLPQRGVMLDMLASLGATKVAVATDGAAALDIVRAPGAPVDIIISDLDMPGMDGMEFIRHLGQAALPVSLILASVLERSLLSSVETMTRAYGVRILGVIEKPVTRAKLEALIKLHVAVVQRKAGLDAALDTGLSAAGPSFTIDEIVAGLGSDEFEPWFQPKVDLATGQMTGAEALARWRHPKLGIVAPFAFISLLENNGLIDMLTWVMLRKAAVFCRQWRAASALDVSVSVNLSIKSLAEPRLAARVAEVVCGEDLDPRHMVLELTESAATTDVGLALENLARLRMKGFGLSIDDYGTGYSSMQQLTRISFTELKIDQSFVTNAARQPSARVILKSSLDMARKLKIASVAEGVETRQDRDLLGRLGCQLAQGFLFARPMETGALLHWNGDLLGARERSL